MTNKTILEKNDFFSDHDTSLGSRFAPKHATCDFQLNLTHCFAGTLNLLNFFISPFPCVLHLFYPVYYNKGLFSRKKRAHNFLEIGLHSIIE